MKLDLRAKWQKVRSETTKGEGASRALADKALPVYVTYDTETMRPGVLVVLSGNQRLRGLPKWREVTIEQDRRGSDTGVHLRLETGSYEAIFAALAGDVVDSLQGEPQQRWRTILVNRIQFWRQFFREQGFQGLNHDKQRGLFAELGFLRDHALPRMGPTAVTRWTGPDAAPQDYALPGGFVEVKAASPDSPGRVKINGVPQLDPGESTLLLHVVSLDADEAGSTLPSLVAELRGRLSGGALRDFNAKLLAAGYLDVHEAEYLDVLAVCGEATYDVRDGFPRIASAPPEVSRLRYELDVSSATGYLVPAAALDAMCGVVA